MSKKLREGSVLGGVLLIAGSSIGAGMLALPVVTGLSGFISSSCAFLFAWLFMTTTAFLLLEVNLTLGHQFSLTSLAEKTLGRTAKGVTWFFFLFLLYSLNIAYIVASGPILEGLISIPSWTGSLFFVLLFGIFLYKGMRKVDLLNRLFMLGLILSYLALIGIGSYFLDWEKLKGGKWSYAIASLPILVTSFGFHNMIPSLVDYFKGDSKRLRLTCFVGSLIPLVVYLAWEMVMLGILPTEGIKKALDEGSSVAEIMVHFTSFPLISVLIDLFSLFAIITSFLAQSLSLMDFLADGLKMEKTHGKRIFLILLTLVPPALLAFLYPQIFLRALGMAGGFAAVILFGVIPALMVWKLRYKKGEKEEMIIRGGKPLLVTILILSFAIFFIEAFQELCRCLLPGKV